MLTFAILLTFTHAGVGGGGVSGLGGMSSIGATSGLSANILSRSICADIWRKTWMRINHVGVTFSSCFQASNRAESVTISVIWYSPVWEWNSPSVSHTLNGSTQCPFTSFPFVSPFSIHSTVTLSFSSFIDVTIAWCMRPVKDHTGTSEC